MIRKDNRGAVSLSKKGWIILFGSVLTVALAAWIILVAGIFRNKDRNGKSKGHGYDLPEIPEGYVLVFRIKEIYRSSDGEKRQISCDCDYDDFGRLKTQNIYRFGTYFYRLQYAYDERGNVIRETKYDDKGNFVSNTENEYDSEGRLRKTRTDNTVQTFNENGDLLLEYKAGGDDGYAVKRVLRECVYTDDGRILSDTNYESEQTTVYFYDNSGKKERAETRSHGNLISEEIFPTEYTSEYYAFTDDGIRYMKTRSEYDESGNCINLSEYNEDGTVSNKKLTEWGEHGFPMNIYIYKSDILTAWTEYEYGESSFMFTSKATQNYSDGWEKSYSAECALLGIENMNLRGSIYSSFECSFRWEQDFYGNPIRCIRMSDGEESVMYELEFIPMAIPKEYMNDYDRYEK